MFSQEQRSKFIHVEHSFPVFEVKGCGYEASEKGETNKKTKCRTKIQNIFNETQTCAYGSHLSLSFNTSICVEICPKSEQTIELDTPGETVQL